MQTSSTSCMGNLPQLNKGWLNSVQLHGEHRKSGGQIFLLGNDIVGYDNIGRGKVPYTLDTRRNEDIRYLLGIFRRNTEDGHTDSNSL